MAVTSGHNSDAFKILAAHEPGLQPRVRSPCSQREYIMQSVVVMTTARRCVSGVMSRSSIIARPATARLPGEADAGLRFHLRGVKRPAAHDDAA